MDRMKAFSLFREKEKEFLDYISNHLLEVVCIALTLVALLIRVFPRDFVGMDAKYSLLPWFDTIKKGGGFKALSTQVGDYSIFYQELIAFFTYIPVKPIYIYKVIAAIFDVAQAVMVAGLVKYFTKDKFKTVLSYAVALLLPTVLLDSAVWAQCDNMYTFLALAAIYCILKKKNILAFVLLGIAFSIKLQPVLLIPFFLYVWYKKKEYSILHFFLIPITMEVLTIPAVIAGRGIFDCFTELFKQTNNWKNLYNNYPSFWALVFPESNSAHYDMFKMFCILFCVAMLIIVIVFIEKYVKITDVSLLYIAFILTYTTVLFLPSMHERYGYSYELLALVILFINWRTIFNFVSLICIAVVSYVPFLLNNKVFAMHSIAVINLITYGLYIYVLVKYSDKLIIKKEDK